MTQMSFIDAEYSLKKRKTRREKFLEKMEALIPWPELIEQIPPVQPDGCGLEDV
jgi:IS5 family transposase